MDVFVIEQSIDLSGVNMPMIYRQALTQHDAYAHEWRVSVKKHGHAVDLTGCTAQIYFGPENKTGDGIVPGKALTQRAVAQGGAAYAQLLPELYQIDGRVMAIMRISDPEDHVMTAAVLRLHTSGVLEGDIGDPSGSVIELGALLAQLDELRTQTAAAREATAQSKTQQEAAEAAETARSAAESERVAAEEYRVGHESTRQMHENDRVAHEKTRISYETTRRNAETERAAAETARSDAETARAEAEQQRAVNEEARDAAEADRVAAEQARAAAEQARQETFTGYEERIVAATPDDTTVNGRAWTSKKTVDSLCLPFEATGNPVQVYPVEGYPLGVKVSWEPTQAGEGDPSPENVRPITGRDVVSVTRCGENLLPFGERLENIYEKQIMAPDAVLRLSKAYAGQEVTLTFTVETQDLVFADNVEEEWRKRIGFECKGIVDGTEAYVLQCWINYKDAELTKNGKKTVKTTTFMPKLTSGYIMFYAQNIKSGSFAAYDFGIYAGTTAPTPYEPYTGSTTDIALPETVYGGEVDAVTGEGQETWKKPFDFSEYEGGNRIHKGLGSGGWAQSDNAVPWFVYDDGFQQTSVVCDKLKAIASITSITTPYSIGIGNSWIAIRGPWHTSEEVRAWLRQQKPMVSYQLTTPTTITATGAQPICALSGVNTIYSDAGTLTVTGREDPRHTIFTLTDRIAALESAAAGV